MANAPRRRVIILTALIFSIGILASVGAQRLSVHLLAAGTQARFEADTAGMAGEIGQRLRAHAEVLVSMQGLYASVGRVDRGQFQRYVDVLDLVRRYPGFAALQVLRQVKPDELDDFVSEVRSDHSLDPRGQPSFEIHPEGPRPLYYVIYFIEPMRGNEKAFGYDVGSNPAELESLTRSALGGRIVATPPVKLVQDTSGGLGFILRAPIYRVDAPAATPEQRRVALFGFAAAVYRMNDLMRGVLDARTLQQMIVRVVDRGYAKVSADGVVTDEPEDPAGESVLMYDSREPNLRLVTPVASSPIGVSAERVLVVGDRLWLLQFAAREGSTYEIDRSLPGLVLASGGIISALLAMICWSALRARRLSGDLTALDAEQRALVENPLAGILFTRGMTVLRGNRRLAEWCGTVPEDIGGVDVATLLAAEQDREAFARAIGEMEAGRTAALELRLRGGAGEAPVPVDAFGRPLYFTARGPGEVLWVMQDRTDALRMADERRDHDRELRAANGRLTDSLHAAEARRREIELLTELSGVLQSCKTSEEIFASVQTYAVRLFPDEAGALYMLNKARDQVVRGSRWGVMQADAASFAPDACWALRRGQTFPLSEASRGLVCDHVAAAANPAPDYVCHPLIAQHSLLGLLYREPGHGPDGAANQLATMLAEQVSLAIANIELREQLRGQALRDPLTGLHNRRFLEDALATEVANSLESGRPLALALLDLDHFKRINDTYSHEAGDAVLRALGETLRERTRASDVVGRFGGEEFVVLLPQTGIDGAAAVASHLLDAVREMRVRWPGGALEGITVSIGLAVFPVHVERGEDLITAADAALYRAKAAGRDRVVLAERLPAEPEGASGA